MFRFAPFAILFVFLFACPVHAQDFTGGPALDAVLVPKHPAPYSTVTVTPSSNSFDLTGSAVTVSVNGAVVAKGSGAAPVQFAIGGPGSKTTVIVTAISPDDQTYTQTLVIRPAEVALIAEPVSSTHPFYRGTGQLASEAGVRLIAIPDLRSTPGTRLSANSLTYTWKVGDRILTTSSGVGRSTLTATAPVQYRDALVNVVVTNPDQSIVAEASMLLSPVNPIVRIYADDPLLGPLFNKALSGAYTMTDTETTFRAVPYFFSAAQAFAWKVNGAPNGTDADITVRSTGDGAGTATLGITTSNATNRQSATSQLSVGFGAAKKLGIFGL